MPDPFGPGTTPKTLQMHESEASFQAVVDPYGRADFFMQADRRPSASVFASSAMNTLSLPTLRLCVDRCDRPTMTVISIPVSIQTGVSSQL